MLHFTWVEADAFCTADIDLNGRPYNVIREKGIDFWNELERPGVNEREAFIATVDVCFSSSNKTYTYLVDRILRAHKILIHKIDNLDGHVVDSRKETVEIVQSRYRTRKELEALAKRQGFSFTDYKVIHGITVE